MHTPPQTAGKSDGIMNSFPQTNRRRSWENSFCCTACCSVAIRGDGAKDPNLGPIRRRLIWAGYGVFTNWTCLKLHRFTLYLGSHELTVHAFHERLGRHFNNLRVPLPHLSTIPRLSKSCFRHQISRCKSFQSSGFSLSCGCVLPLVPVGTEFLRFSFGSWWVD
jgi:hypothetical protein